jgi:MerR family transcriptional regulator/heat shock protein HspR
MTPDAWPSMPDPRSPARRNLAGRSQGSPALGSSSIDDPLAALYSVGQVAAMLGVQQAFLRRLDTEEVVRPERSAGGQRRYSRDEIDQVGRVASMMGEGMTLPAIRHIIVLEAELDRLRRELADVQARLDGSDGRAAPSPRSERSREGR